MKKIFLIILFVFIFLSFNQTEAACPTEGLVPCGTSDCPCQFCHFFVLFKNILDFLLTYVVPPVAVLMLAIAGFMFFFGGMKPEILTQAKSTLKATVMALVIIYGAWIFVGAFFTAIGVADWTKLKEGWWQIKCP